MNMQSPLIAIVGPTASGKTDLAIHLAQQTGGGVVSADSRQVYAGFNIGTAKPREGWRLEAHTFLQSDTIANVDHFLLNVSSPLDRYTLASWQSAAFAVITHLHQKNVVPYLVGGTMLYIDSILDNFSLPHVAPDPTLRQELAQRTPTDLYRELITRDPAAAQFVEPHHTQRIIRALEVIKATNTPFSELRKKRPSPYHSLAIGLFPGWEQLKKALRDRASAMLEGGLLEEVRALQARFTTHLPLLATMNYREADNLLHTTVTRHEALEAMVRSNMKYARRQMAWWKNRKSIIWYQPSARIEITRTVREFLSATDQ